MNLLITGAWADAKEHMAQIEAMGHAIAYIQQEKDELPCEASWVEGVICNGLFLYHPIDQFPNLRWIQLTSAGYDRIPMDYVRDKGITINNARGVYSIPMAEFAVAGVLALCKGLYQFRDQQKRREWVKNRELRELAGSRVAIVGCGSVGTECAKRFKAFGCAVIGVDVAVRQDENYDDMVGLEKLDEELTKADVVVLTLPLTEESRGLIDGHRLGLISGILVNISRGAVVDQKALERWNGRAVLDVFEEEPLEIESPLWGKDGFLITPHNSFVGDRNRERLFEIIFSQLMNTEVANR